MSTSDKLRVATKVLGIIERLEQDNKDLHRGCSPHLALQKNKVLQAIERLQKGLVVQ